MEIVLNNISYHYKNRKVVDHISFTVSNNRITGITGQNKSLICGMIAGVKAPYSGSITVDGVYMCKETIKDMRRKISIIYQNCQDQFFTNQVREEFQFLISRLHYQPKDLAKKMKQALEMVGLNEDYLDRSIEMLSYSEKKLLQIAVALIPNPDVIIFDEAFVELDYHNQKQLIKVIKMLRDKYHKTVIISSNDVNMLYELTDDIVVLNNGRVFGCGNTVEFYQNKDLINSDIILPDLVIFTILAKSKKVKLSYHRDIRDLIKDVYKHV